MIFRSSVNTCLKELQLIDLQLFLKRWQAEQGPQSPQKASLKLAQKLDSPDNLPTSRDVLFDGV